MIKSEITNLMPAAVVWWWSRPSDAGSELSSKLSSNFKTHSPRGVSLGSGASVRHPQPSAIGQWSPPARRRGMEQPGHSAVLVISNQPVCGDMGPCLACYDQAIENPSLAE